MKEELEHIDIFELLNRYFAGEASIDDVDYIKNWLSESKENQETYNQYKLVWENLEKYRINKLVDVNSEWNAFKSKLSTTKTIQLEPKKQNRLFLKISRYAAIFLLFITIGGAGYYLANQSGKEKYLAKSKINEVALPDHSKVTLNKNSRIIVSKDYDKEKREIKLVGEAYFEVEKTGKPFIVKTNGVEIEVLGTSFLVSTIREENAVEVIVNTGKVSVTLLSDRSNKVILNPGEKAYFRKKVKELKKLSNTDINFISWKTKKLIFKNDKLSKVVKTLNKIHKSNIQIINKEIEDCRLTVSFVDQSLESILKVIESTLNIEVETKDGIVYLKGEGC